MTKVKKIITTLALVVMIALSSLAMFACGKPIKKEDSKALIETTLTTYKQNTNMFSANTINGFETNFYLVDFSSKDKWGSLVNDCDKYIAFAGIGLDYIEDFYPLLDALIGKYDFKTLNNKVEKMNTAYGKANKELAKLKNLDSDVDYNIYNGNFARYKLEMKSFIDEIYETANYLGDMIINVSGIEDVIGTEDMTDSLLTAYIHYHKFLISKDYKIFFIDSAGGVNFSDSLYLTAYNKFYGYCSMRLDYTELSMTAEEAKELKEVVEAVNGDRQNVYKSLENFSVYEFLNTYDSSLEAYEKDNQEAKIYYSNIMNYFGSTGILDKLSTML